MNTLETIARLQADMKSDASIQEAESWWGQCVAIEMDLARDPRCAREERTLVESLKSGVSDAILQIRRQYPFPDFTSTRVALGALQGSIERRTIGVDGRPLRGSD